MSIERHERSPSFRMRQQTAKIIHHSKLIPTDFFPKAFSQSPKKKSQAPTSTEMLQEWYQRQESKQKPKKQFHRVSYNRPSVTRLSFVAIQQHQERQRYNAQNLGSAQQDKTKLIRLQKIHENQEKTKVKIQKKIMLKICPPTLQEKERKIRLVRSQNKSKNRSQTSQSVRKISTQHKSMREIPRQFEAKELGVGFDGMVTFSKFK